MKLEGVKINFLGDSITQGSGTTCPEAVFPELLRRDCGLAEARNYGIGGTRLARQFTPSENPVTDFDCCQRYLTMDLDADVVVVFGGTNDYGHGDAPFGECSDRTPDTFHGACHALFAGLKVRYPNAVIAVLTPLHRCNETNPLGDGRKKLPCPPLKDYVDVIRQTAQEYQFPVLDLYETSLLNPNVSEIRNAYVPDGLHPNDAGHRVLAKEIKEFLLSL